MNRTTILSVSILAVAFLLSIYIYTKNTRFHIVPTGVGVTSFKIDRITGQTWFIIGNEEELVVQIKK